MAYVNYGPEWENMKVVLRSFGYAVIAKYPRLLCLAPCDDTIFIPRVLARKGYWELNQVDRWMWEKYGAMGYPLREWLPAAVLIEFMYKYATGQFGIINGYHLSETDAFRQTIYESSQERLDHRLRKMYVQADMEYMDKYSRKCPNRLAERQAAIDIRMKEIQEALDSAESAHRKAREQMNVIMEIKSEKASKRQRHKAK